MVIDGASGLKNGPQKMRKSGVIPDASWKPLVAMIRVLLAVGFVEALTDQTGELGAAVVVAAGERRDGGVEPGGVGDGEGADGSVTGDLGGVAGFVEGAGGREPFHDPGGAGLPRQAAPTQGRVSKGKMGGLPPISSVIRP